MAILKDLIVNGASRFIGTLNASSAKITTINGVTVGDSPKFTDTTALTSMTGTLPVGNGGTGQTTAKNAANAFMNALDTGSSTPADADYYISQYVNGGTSTTTYHRRPMSALWSYISGKISSVLGLTASTYGGNAATATKATQDESGNNIKATYAASASISGNTVTLKNKNGGTLSTVTIPTELPAVTTSDNGKVLRVVSGAWSAVNLPSASGVSF